MADRLRFQLPQAIHVLLEIGEKGFVCDHAIFDDFRQTGRPFTRR